MIKLSFCLTRKDHLTREEFQDYWINIHAPLVKSVSKDLKIISCASSEKIFLLTKHLFLVTNDTCLYKALFSYNICIISVFVAIISH